MEIQNKGIEMLHILNIERTESGLKFLKDVADGESINITLIPKLLIDCSKQVFVTKIDVIFYDEEKNRLNAPFHIAVIFGFDDFHSLFLIDDKEKRIEIKQMPILINMFDTSLGILRGIMSELTKGTTLSGFILPNIVMNDFIPILKVKLIEDEATKIKK